MQSRSESAIESVRIGRVFIAGAVYTPEASRSIPASSGALEEILSRLEES